MAARSLFLPQRQLRRVKFKPQGPARIDWTHPIARGLSFAHLFDPSGFPLWSNNGTPPIAYGGSPKWIPGPGGYGLNGASSFFGAISGNSFRMNSVTGTVLLFVTADHVSTDATNRTLVTIGATAAFPTGPTFELTSQGNMLNGWYAGADNRMSTSLTGLYSAGDTFTIGATYDTGAPLQELYCKGTRKNSSSSALTTGNNGVTDFEIGTFSSNGWNWLTSSQGMIYAAYIWDRVLSANEFLALEQSPYCFISFLQDEIFAARVGTAAASGALTGTSAATTTVTGTLTGAGALTGTSAATTTVSATLTGTGALTATSAATSTVTGTLSGAGALTSTSAATSTVTGTLTDAASFSGTSAATSTVTGTLSAIGALIGSSAITSSVSGTLHDANTSNIWTPVTPASGTWTPTTPASGTWSPI